MVWAGLGHLGPCGKELNKGAVRTLWSAGHGCGAARRQKKPASRQHSRARATSHDAVVFVCLCVFPLGFDTVFPNRLTRFPNTLTTQTSSDRFQIGSVSFQIRSLHPRCIMNAYPNKISCLPNKLSSFQIRSGAVQFGPLQISSGLPFFPKSLCHCSGRCM